MKHEAGKGDTYRPVNKKIYSENYDKAFGVKRPLWISEEAWNKMSEQEKKEILA